MSILAKLLQKKQEDNPETGQIPPGLLQAVARSGSRSGGRKRSLYLLIVCGGLASVLAGFYVMSYLQKHTPIAPAP